MTKKLKAWQDQKFAVMAAENAVGELAQQLVVRWSQADESRYPPLLDLPDWKETGFRWGELIELAIVAANETVNCLDAEDTERVQAGQFLQNLVRACTSAWEATTPDVSKGTLWLLDILSLRFLSKEIAPEFGVQAFHLLIAVCEAIIGKMPQNDQRSYNAVYEIYEALSNAMVTEVFDKNRLSIRWENGLRQISSTTPTLFRTAVNYDYWRSDKAQNWRTTEPDWLIAFNAKRIEVAEKLFETLTQMNPEFEGLAQGRLVTGRGRNTDHSQSEIYGLQRRLDVPWHRMSHAMRTRQHVLSERARSYIRDVYDRNSELLTPPPEIEEDGLGEEPMPIPDEVLAKEDDTGRLTFLPEIERQVEKYEALEGTEQ